MVDQIIFWFFAKSYPDVHKKYSLSPQDNYYNLLIFNTLQISSEYINFNFEKIFFFFFIKLLFSYINRDLRNMLIINNIYISFREL